MTLPISTPNLVLRAFREDDLHEFVAYRNDPDVARFQSWDGTSRAEAEAFLRGNAFSGLGIPGRWQQIAIAVKPEDRLVGDIGVSLQADGRFAELGFTLAAAHQGRGFAGEALTALIEGLFRRPGLERLDAVTDARNAPAIALLRRLGFALRSTAAATFKGADCEEHTFSLFREAWAAARPR